MLKAIVPKFRSYLSVRFRDIAEKQVPAKLKPIVGVALVKLDWFCLVWLCRIKAVSVRPEHCSAM